MRPLGSRVLLKRSDTGEKIGRIIIPERFRSKAQEGEVIAVGDRVSSLFVGDRVLFGRHAALENADGTLLLYEDAVMAVLE